MPGGCEVAHALATMLNPVVHAMTQGDTVDPALLARFGVTALHGWQREAISFLSSTHARLLVVAPTGGGKSLTYQLPAAMLPGVTIVVSPLVALMEDQVRALEARGVSATYLASTLDAEARRTREAEMRKGRYKLVYLAPERLANEMFVAMLSRMEIPLVAVDEAHCIAQWGHDFRPEYMRVGAFLERIRPPRVLACTATATHEVRREIRLQLGLDGADSREILRGFARPNLHLSAASIEGPTDARTRTDATLRRVLGSTLRPKGGAIVYTATRKHTEQLSAWLSQKGWNAQSYHAGLEGDVRARVSAQFAAREVDVVVATNAFGMGIDRADIRAVVHAQPPASIEAYYQEVGRAGRDGNDAWGVLLCSGQDIFLRRRLVELSTDDRPVEPAMMERNWSMFRDLLRYLDACTCRHDFMLRYFGDERETLGGCGHCDVCAQLDGLENESDDVMNTDGTLVRVALSGIARVKGRVGMNGVAEMLRGAISVRVERMRLDSLSTYGMLKEYSQDWVLALLRGLIAAGWIDVTTGEYPVPFVTPTGWSVMKGQGTVRFRLPPPPAPKTRARQKSSASALVTGIDSRLYEMLKLRRAELAKQRNVPPYVIALDRTLQEIAARRPSTLAELSTIYGLGPARLEDYGATLLDVVRASGVGASNVMRSTSAT